MVMTVIETQHVPTSMDLTIACVIEASPETERTVQILMNAPSVDPVMPMLPVTIQLDHLHVPVKMGSVAMEHIVKISMSVWMLDPVILTLLAVTARDLIPAPVTVGTLVMEPIATFTMTALKIPIHATKMPPVMLCMMLCIMAQQVAHASLGFLAMVPTARTLMSVLEPMFVIPMQHVPTQLDRSHAIAMQVTLEMGRCV